MNSLSLAAEAKSHQESLPQHHQEQQQLQKQHLLSMTSSLADVSNVSLMHRCQHCDAREDLWVCIVCGMCLLIAHFVITIKIQIVVHDISRLCLLVESLFCSFVHYKHSAHVGCSRYQSGHAVGHYEASGHRYALELKSRSQLIWDYSGRCLISCFFVVLMLNPDRCLVCAFLSSNHHSQIGRAHV